MVSLAPVGNPVALATLKRTIAKARAPERLLLARWDDRAKQLYEYSDRINAQVRGLNFGVSD